MAHDRRVRVAFLFPGQGSQHPGMCSDLFGTVYAANLDAAAREVLGFSLIERIENARDEELMETALAQPALYFVGYLSYLLVVEKYNVVPVGAAGHSLGELTALAAARVFSFGDGLALVRERARLMDEACRETLGGMVAVIGDGVQSLVKLAPKHGVYPANFNASNQIVFAGELRRLDEFRAEAAQLGFRAVMLKVSGAFHSPYMEKASSGLAGVVGRMKLSRPAFPVMSNATGEDYQSKRLADLVALQVSSPVRWTGCLESLAERNPEIWVEACPGKTLLRMVPEEYGGRRIALRGRADYEELAEAVKTLSGGGIA